MCTVTFIPTSLDTFILTSNRDEAPDRETLPPAREESGGVQLLFPKDKRAGGTWIGLSNKKRLICLLNGGFTAHERQESYRMSRGIIVTDLLTAENAEEKITQYNFQDIEPFTIILVEWAKDLQVFELVWDGARTHFSEKPIAPQIWSSSLLYTEAMKRKREQWFSEFLFSNLKPSPERLLHFHKTAGEGDLTTNLIMDRGFVQTKSITQIIKSESSTEMRYEDLQQNEVTQKFL